MYFKAGFARVTIRVLQSVLEGFGVYVFLISWLRFCGLGWFSDARNLKPLKRHAILH